MSALYLVALAWIYVVGLMAIAEGTAKNGSWLGAFFTFALYGVLPLAVALYLLAAPARRRARRSAAGDPDGSGHPAADPVAPVREEP